MASVSEGSRAKLREANAKCVPSYEDLVALEKDHFAVDTQIRKSVLVQSVRDLMLSASPPGVASLQTTVPAPSCDPPINSIFLADSIRTGATRARFGSSAVRLGPIC